MKEHPILFSAPMVRAIIEGRKTQTRRVVTVPWFKGKRVVPYSPYCEVFDGKLFYDTEYDGFVEAEKFCPYGQPGDRLWVREKFQPLFASADETEDRDYKTGKGYKISYPATDGIQEFHDIERGLSHRCWPSIHMPRWASRITLEITDVQVEREQDISEGDAEAEGATTMMVDSGGVRSDGLGIDVPCYVDGFASLWDSINSARGLGWDTNPWVWVISFKRVEPTCK